MNWVQWLVLVVVLFAFTIFWVSSLSWLLMKAGETAKEVVKEYLHTKRVLLLQLEEELGESGSGKVGRRSQTN